MSEYDNDNPFGLETESDFHKVRINTTIALINAIITKTNCKILDVGCGRGIITKHIKELLPYAQIDGIDISEKAIQHAMKENNNIHYVKEDAITFKGFGYKYDVILLNNIYEHIENPCELLKNLKNILENDGYFIISTPNRYHIRNVIRKLFGLQIVIPKYHITEYSIGQIHDHHIYSGLKILKIFLPQYTREKFRLFDYLIFQIFQPIIDRYLQLVKSRTRMGSLLFIVSKKEGYE